MSVTNSLPLFDEIPFTRIHFIAVCGVAMASVAAELHRAGFVVTGSDTGFYPPMGTFLEEQGVKTLQGFDPSHLPDDGLIVVGNAVSRGNVELEAALSLGLQLISLSDLVARRHIGRRKSAVVTGTHGKTTTTSMLAHILRSAGRDPGWMIGGIPQDLPVPCRLGKGNEFVIEGDEYDVVYNDKRPKFLLYKPFYAIINGIEFDHADIYQDLDAIELQFRRFVRLIPRNGCLVVNGDDPLAMSISKEAFCKVITFGLGKNCNYRMQSSRESVTNYKLVTEDETSNISVQLPGEHNMKNGVAAIALACEIGVQKEVALRALANFRGVARRLELVVDTDKLKIYDDFAHHPTAINGTLSAIKLKHPNHSLWAILEPRSNTMVRNFHSTEITEALSIADHVIIGKLHRLDSVPIHQRLDRNAIQSNLESAGVGTFSSDNVDDTVDFFIRNRTGKDVIVIMSNGGFDGIREKLKKRLS
ncbi:MAG: hypothetical protein HN757_07535 [Calditrichaeota bacterium]|nr:hypothetical protein [Calditrichota bacterium]